MERERLFISELDAIAGEAIRKIADSHGFDHAAFDIATSVRLASDTMFHIERWQCDRPRILCNAFSLASVKDRKAKARWESGALKAIIGAVSMLRRSALLSPEQAMEIRATRLESRRVSARFRPLPSRYFSTSAIITVTDRISGQSLTGNTLPGESLEECQSRLRQELSVIMLRNDETAELVDTLEQARTFSPAPVAESVTVSESTTVYSF